LNKTAREVEAQLDAYDFHGVVQTLYHFFWDDFCDWYIELSKAIVTAETDSDDRKAARARLISILEQALRLLHPFMPYLTEELWQKLPIDHAKHLHAAYAGAELTIMLAAFPKPSESLIDEQAENEMQAVINLISRVRNIRSEMNIKPGDRIQLMIAAKPEMQSVFTASADQIARLTRAADVAINGSAAPKAAARAVLSGGAEVAVPLEGLIDFSQERARLGREKDKLQTEAARLETQLANADFVARAPAEKVAELRSRVTDIAERATALDQMLDALS
jgi:valyl-tRNA synthetase